jgi:hypothetical protein
MHHDRSILVVVFLHLYSSFKYTAFAVRCGRSSFGDTWSSCATRRSTLHFTFFTVHNKYLEAGRRAHHDKDVSDVVDHVVVVVFDDVCVVRKQSELGLLVELVDDPLVDCSI